MNDKIYNLILKILDSELPKSSQDEIVRFFVLPRNTPVKPMIEIPEEPEADVGTVKRPSPHDLDRRANPVMADTEDATRELFDKAIKPDGNPK